MKFFAPVPASSSATADTSSTTADASSGTPSAASFSADVEDEESEQSDSQRQQRKFLMRWKLIFPWVELEDGGNEKFYCRECRSAKLKNVFCSW